MLPFAVTGFTFASFNALNKIKEYKYSTFILCIIIFLFVDYFNIFFPMDPYNGIKPNIQSICLIFIFSNLSFDKIKNKYIKTIIEYITRYTAGIYYLHIHVYHYFKYYIQCMRKKNIGGLFINYIICYSICHFGMIIFGKTKARNLFS